MKAIHPFEVLRRPVVTEKNTALLAQSKYSFEVARRANKHQIKEAVERAFRVKVMAVNIISMPAKTRLSGRRRGQTSPWKKAIVTLREGDKIEIFEGV